ncbi:MAG: aldo/keto reductase [Terrimicrobiaceae bacterium]
MIPSRLGFGTGTLGTLGVSATAHQVSCLLDLMLSNGISVIDTADTYGSGHAEHLLGIAMRGRRERFFLMTKAGYRYGDLPWPLRILNPFVKKALHRIGRRQRFEPKYLERCLKRSLRRLETGWVDVFFLHDPAMTDLARPGLVEMLENLRKQGLVGELGVSSGKPEVLRMALSSGWAKFIQCPANLVDAHRLQDVLKSCGELGVTVVANYVFGRGNFGIPELTHEVQMRATSALLPDSAVILCGTKNPQHLIQSHQWAKAPLAANEALQLLEKTIRLTAEQHAIKL